MNNLTQQKQKILIADDSEMNRELLVSILEDEYEIIQVKDGVQAVDCLQKHLEEISLFLLDLVMPQMDGFEVLAYMNKEHWNTIVLDGTIPDKDIKRMISESYDLVTYSPTKRIYEAVKKIPKGCVATYGKVAEMAGNPRMSRAVGNALHKNPDPEHIPCYRVVNSKGELAGAFAFGGENVQKKLLEADGIEVINGKVDLKKYGL